MLKKTEGKPIKVFVSLDELEKVLINFKTDKATLRHTINEIELWRQANIEEKRLRNSEQVIELCDRQLNEFMIATEQNHQDMQELIKATRR